MAQVKWINLTPGLPIVGDFTSTAGLGTPICIDASTDGAYYLAAGDIVTPILGGGGGGAVWGGITGDITDQTDLQDALDLKYDKTGGIVSGSVIIDGGGSFTSLYVEYGDVVIANGAVNQSIDAPGTGEAARWQTSFGSTGGKLFQSFYAHGSFSQYSGKIGYLLEHPSADKDFFTIDNWRGRIELKPSSTQTTIFSSTSTVSSVDISVPDEAYGIGWDGSLEVPTKNALYDKIQTIVGGGSYPPDGDYGDVNVTSVGLAWTVESANPASGTFEINADTEVSTGHWIDILGGYMTITTDYESVALLLVKGAAATDLIIDFYAEGIAGTSSGWLGYGHSDNTFFSIHNEIGVIRIQPNNTLTTTFSSSNTTSTVDIIVPDEVYGVGWNGSFEVPTKNAVYDKIETVISGGVVPPNADYGDITVTSSGTVWTIDAGVVTLAKMANVATATVFYRKTAGTGSPEVQTLATLKTDLGLTGTNSGDQTITLTSDVTGSGTGSFATTIAAGVVTLAKMANIATDRLIGRDTAATGVPEVITVSGGVEFTGAGGIQTSAFTGDVTKAAGGTATTIANNAVSFAKFVAAPSAGVVWAASAANYSHNASGGGTANFLRADGSWAVPPGGGGYTPPTGTGFPHITAGAQDAAAKLVDTADINNSQVTLAKLADMATASLYYRKTASTGAPEVNSLATLKTDLGLTGTNSGDQTITLTGHVTGSGTGSFATTIQPAVVTLAMQANVATSTVFYRKTAGAGAPEVQTLATLKTDLGLTGTNSGDQTSIVGITGTIAQFNTACTDADFATGGGTATGTNTGDQTITLTSDVTGSGTGSFATTIANNAVTLAKMADMATASLIYRKTAGTGDPEVNTLATLKTDLNLSGTNTGDQTTITGNAGTATALQNSRDFSIAGAGITAAAVAFNGTANVVLAGSVDAGHITLARMANMATASLIYRKTAGSGAPEVNTLATLKTDLGLTGTNSGDQTITLTGDVTGSGTGSFAATIAANAVTFAKHVAAPSAGIVWAAGAGNYAHNASGGGSVNFLRADGSWAVPPGGGGVSDGDYGDVAISGGATVYTVQTATGVSNDFIYTPSIAGYAQFLIRADASASAILNLQRVSSADQAQIYWTGTTLTFVPIAGGNIDMRGDTIRLRSSTAVTTRLTVDSTGITAALDVFVPDEAYGSGWNADLSVPTKNAVYDKIEAVIGAYDGDKGDVDISGTGTVYAVQTATGVLSAGVAPVFTINPAGVSGTTNLLVLADAASTPLITLRRAASSDQFQISWNGTNGVFAAVAGGGIELRGDVIAFRTSTAVATYGRWSGSNFYIGTGTSVDERVMPSADELAPWDTLLNSSGSHTAARANGTYWLGQGDPAGVTAVGTLYGPNIIYLDPADYVAIGGLNCRLRIKAQLFVNDTAPTGNYTFGLHPMTRPATSGAAGVCIFTVGAAVGSSTVLFTAPAVDSSNQGVSAEFAVPAAGYYCIGFVSTVTVVASSHLVMSAQLQKHYT